MTEAGYCHNVSTGDLMLDHASIADDLNNLGSVVRGLFLRREPRHIQGNGGMAKKFLLQLCSEAYPDIIYSSGMCQRFFTRMMRYHLPASQIVLRISSIMDVLIGYRNGFPPFDN